MKEQLKKAMLEKLQNEMELIEKEDCSEIEASKELDFKVKETIGKKTKSVPRRLLFVAAILVSLLLLTVTAYAFHEDVLNIIYKISNSAVDIEIVDAPNAPKQIENVYTPTYIPEGYEQLERKGDTQSVTQIWSNGKREIIVCQSVISGNLNVSISNKNTTEEYINGQRTYISYQNDTYCAVWITDEYYFNVNCPGLNREDVESIILSMNK